jgi:hypothetical protein
MDRAADPNLADFHGVTPLQPGEVKHIHVSESILAVSNGHHLLCVGQKNLFVAISRPQNIYS